MPCVRLDFFSILTYHETVINTRALAASDKGEKYMQRISASDLGRFRLLKGDPLAGDEIICGVEYTTGSGFANLFAGVCLSMDKLQPLLGETKPESLQLVQSAEGWTAVFEGKGEPVQLELDTEELEAYLAQNGIDLAGLRRNSAEVEQSILEEKQREKESQEHKHKA